jgi:tetratricopeptide (TPR) repeat protein
LTDPDQARGSYVERVQLLDLAARIDRECGNYQEALGHLERARHLARTGAQHLEVPLAAVEGVLRLDLGQLYKADDVLTYALTRQSEEYGADHPRVALVSNNLGIVRQELGDLKQAWVLYNKAKEINASIYGREDERVAANLMNMGNVLTDLGGHDMAVALMEESIRIRAGSAASKRTWAIGIAFHNLAYAHFCGGRHTWAESLFRKALALKSQSLPPEDPRMLNTWCGLIRSRLRLNHPCSYESSLLSVISTIEQNHPDNRIVQGLLWIALAESYYFRERHPSHRHCALRADHLLGRWGGQSTDRNWIRQLAS